MKNYHNAKKKGGSKQYTHIERIELSNLGFTEPQIDMMTQLKMRTKTRDMDVETIKSLIETGIISQNDIVSGIQEYHNEGYSDSEYSDDEDTVQTISHGGGYRFEPFDLKEKILLEFAKGDDHDLALFADSFSLEPPPVVWDIYQELYVINDDLVALEPHTLIGVDELNKRIKQEMKKSNYGYETPGGGGKRKTRRKNNKNSKKTKRKVPLRYLPKRLSKKDKVKQRRELSKSRKAYKKGTYYTRKKVSSFKSKTSDHILKARKIYKLDKISPSKELSKKTGCSIASLQKMVKKGQGAYYSSGSRPNQTSTSWGLARMASDVTGGKAAAVDFNILDEGCDHSKKAYKLAVQARKKHKFGKRKVPKASD